jgi:hypothetical protein
VTPTAHLPWALSGLSTLARCLWFLAWSALAAGAAWSRAFTGATPGERDAGAVWRRALQLGWLWLSWATTLALVVLLLVAITTSNAAPVNGETGLGWVVLVVGLALLRPVVRRATTGDGALAVQDRAALAWLAGALAVGEVLTHPTRTRAAEGVRAALAAAHLGSAGLWLGSLALLVVLVRSDEWRAAGGGTGGAVVRTVVETACRAAAVLVVSGIAAAAVTSPGLGHWAAAYSGLLAAKAVVLVVAAAIALRQWSAVHRPLPSPVLGRSLLVQAGALVSAAALAAVLIGVDPLVASSAAPARTVVPTSSLASPPCVAAQTDCDGATVSSVVFSTPDNGLDAVIPGLCTADPAKPKAFAYFTCLQAVGQALAQKAAGSPSALDHCLELPGVWVQQSCAAGIFSALVAHDMGAPPNDDPNRGDTAWPCRSVPDDVAPPCYLLAATRILWLNGGDLQGAFRTCDQLASEWQGYCYQGAGREITTRAGYAPAAILSGCGSAGGAGPGPCLEGAARTLVFTGHGAAASSLCAAAGPVNGPACDSERRAALETM